MQEISVNFWALLGFVAVRVVIGMFWYSPQGFWKPWSQVTGLDEKRAKRGMPKSFASDLLGSFLMAFVLLHFIKYAGASQNLAQGLKISFCAWLAFVGTVQFAMTAYEQRPIRFFAIISGYQLISILAGGLVLTQWG